LNLGLDKRREVFDTVLNVQERSLLTTALNAKQRILKTAANLFWENSFEATGVAQILKSSKVGSGSLYWFFDTKEDLLLAILDDYATKLRPVIATPAFNKSGDSLERIFLILDGYREVLLNTDFRLGCPIGNIVLELGNRYPRVREKTEKLFAAWREMIIECLSELSDNLPRDTQFESLAILVLSIMEGGIMQARLHKDIKYFDAGVLHLKNYFSLLIGRGN